MLFVDSLLNAPLPNLLIVLGAFFVLLAVVSKLATNTPLGTVDADGKGRMVAGVIGPLLIVMGLLVIPALTPGPIPDPEPTPVPDPNGTGLVLTENSRTPPPDITAQPRTVTPVPTDVTPIPADPDRMLFERESNDLLTTATLVESGVTITGEIRSTYDPDPSMDTDYYAVWVDAGDPITVDMARETGVGTLYVTILDPNGLPEPNRNWLTDIITVPGGQRVQLNAVARQSGYHYVGVAGWVYLADYDLYFNDGGHGGYTVDIGAVGGQASVIEPHRVGLNPVVSSHGGESDVVLAGERVAAVH
jgi:hypothetical protein